MDTERALQAVVTNLEAAQKHLDDIHQEMEYLEAIGMYPSVPTEQWQDRGGAGQYLYMLFRQDGHGQYTGPNGKRKLYVGSLHRKIEEARRLAANRRQWEDLSETARDLKRWIEGRKYDIEHLANGCQRWPQADLGLPVANQVEENVPNEMVNEQELA